MNLMDAIWVSLAALMGFGLALGVNYLLLNFLLKTMRRFIV